jgi:hypothetical protein
MQAWRKSTKAHYASAWRKWVLWARKRDVDPVQADVPEFLTYLSELVSTSNLSFATLEGYRSAISTIHPKINGVPLGQNPVVSLFFRGLYNIRPSLPRYSATWSYDVVLEFLENSWSANNLLNLKQLTLKLVALLAVSRPSRANEWAFVGLPNSNQPESDGTFLLPCTRPLKNQKRGALFNFVLEPVPHRKTICPVTILQAYLTATSKLRSAPAAKQRLLLSYIKPHHPVTPVTVARWLLTVMSAAGVNTNTYKAHSTRGAAAVQALKSGMSLAEILKRGHWLSASTFQKFYNKEVD